LYEIPPEIVIETPSACGQYTQASVAKNEPMQAHEAHKQESQRSLENEAQIRSQLPADQTASHYSFGMLLEFFYTQQQPRECMAHPNTDTQPADINTLRNASKTQITHPAIKALALNLCSLYAKDRPDAKHAQAVLTIARSDLQADSAQTRAGKKRFHSQI
jgi:hypothetical protein